MAEPTEFDDEPLPDENDALDEPNLSDDDGLPPDDGGEDDEGLPDDRGEPEPDQPRQPRRANDAVRAARERAQRAEQRAAELERQIAERLAPQQPRVDPAEEERRFRESIQHLSYEEQMDARVNRERQLFGGALNSIRAELQQSQDQSAFNALVARNPVAARHADEVERQASQYARAGQFVARELILKNLLGDLALKRGPAARARDGQRAARNIDRNRTQGATRRSDVGAERSERGDSLEAIEARLRGFFGNGGTLADIK